MLRLLIVEDEAIIADGLEEYLGANKGVELDIAKAYEARSAIAYLEKHRVDIVLTDICMPEMSGLELAKRIVENWPWARIVFLTGQKDFENAYEALQMKKVRFLLKTEGYSKVLAEIEEVASELLGQWMEPDLVGEGRGVPISLPAGWNLPEGSEVLRALRLPPLLLSEPFGMTVLRLEPASSSDQALNARLLAIMTSVFGSRVKYRLAQASEGWQILLFQPAPEGASTWPEAFAFVSGTVELAQGALELEKLGSFSFIVQKAENTIVSMQESFAALQERLSEFEDEGVGPYLRRADPDRQFREAFDRYRRKPYHAAPHRAGRADAGPTGRDRSPEPLIPIEALQEDDGHQAVRLHLPREGAGHYRYVVADGHQDQRDIRERRLR